MQLDLPHNIDDRFTLIAELGHGAHAIVYRALDRSLGREVAIKVLRAELVDSAVNERFRREIRLTSQLEHPHIAHVYDTGEFMGAPYFVTAIARGASLAERLERERQLPLDEALSIAREVASALEHAHKAGIVHRDVKPANILLTPDGALLTDFGVARALEAVPGTLATSTGVAVGTLLYMSPEQLCAEKGIDGRSDQYSLALVLYEMLAGVSAHVAANAEGLRALRIAAQHTPISRLRSSVPPHVEAALSRALASAPADRFRAIAAFAEALDGTASSARTIRQTRFTTSSAQMKRRVVAGMLIVGAFGGAGLAKMRWWRPAAAAALPDAIASPSFAIMVAGDTARGAPFARALADELRAWNGVFAESVPDARPRAGMLVETRVTSVAGGVRATLSLGPATKGSARRTVAMQFPVNEAPNADSLRYLAARILMAAAVSPDSAEGLTWVRDRPTKAVLKFGLAWSTLLAGDLVRAEAAFADAAGRDEIPQAHLWQAIVMSWRKPDDPAAWRDAAHAASEQRFALSEGAALIASGLLARSGGILSDACEPFAQASRVDGGSFASWFGLGECQVRDSLVRRDQRSPTGYNFRSSRWAAMKSYERAIDRLPSSKLVSLFERLPRVTLALNGLRLQGRTADDTAKFAGLPGLSADTIQVYPEPLSGLESGRSASIPRSYQGAVRRGQARLLELSARLAEQTPKSFASQLALAKALEYAGLFTEVGSTSNALAQLTKAGAIATQHSDTIELAVVEIRVRLRLGDLNGAAVASRNVLHRTKALDPGDAKQLAVLALLVGDAAKAESLIVQANRLNSGDLGGLPESVASMHATHVVTAVLGSCEQSAATRKALNSAIRSHAAAAEATAMIAKWLTPTDWIRLECPGADIPGGVSSVDPLAAAFAEMRARRTRSARARLSAMERGREGAAESAVSWDTRYLELALLTQSGDTTSARARLGATLAEISSKMDFVLYDEAQIFGLRRTLALCEKIGLPANAVWSLERCRAANRSIANSV